jgi:phage shock protein C
MEEADMTWNSGESGGPGAGAGRLYRDSKNRVILGVCAGIADYFGINPWVVRVLAIIGFVIFTPPTMIGYVILALLLPKAPQRVYRTPGEEHFWTQVRVDPAGSFSELRHRFRELEQRLRNIESYVTSEAYRVNREINDLER